MMDLNVLEAAAGRYRRAVETLGLRWPGPDPAEIVPPSRVAGYYGLGEVPEELRWLHSFVRAGAPVMPEAGYLMPWPTTAQQALDPLELAWAVPFPWRSQIPVFDFEIVVFTLAVDDAHAGEVWRYEVNCDTYAAVRAAPGLAALFENWAEVASRGGLVRDDHNSWLRLDAGESREEEFLREELHVDPFPFPMAPIDEAGLRQRQRECGVDMDRVEDFRGWEAAIYEVDATAKRLDG